MKTKILFHFLLVLNCIMTINIELLNAQIGSDEADKRIQQYICSFHNLNITPRLKHYESYNSIHFQQHSPYRRPKYLIEEDGSLTSILQYQRDTMSVLNIELIAFRQFSNSHYDSFYCMFWIKTGMPFNIYDIEDLNAFGLFFNKNISRMDLALTYIIFNPDFRLKKISINELNVESAFKSDFYRNRFNSDELMSNIASNAKSNTIKLDLYAVSSAEKQTVKFVFKRNTNEIKKITSKTSKK